MIYASRNLSFIKKNKKKQSSHETYIICIVLLVVDWNWFPGLFVLGHIITSFPPLHAAAAVSGWVHIGSCSHREQYLNKSADIEL